MQMNMALAGSRNVNEVLGEVDHHIMKLDQCVSRLAVQMQKTNDCDQLTLLAAEALDANKSATTLADLRMLLMDQKRSEGE